MMTGYLDDSYNPSTVACGGWIARDDVWDRILPKWDKRIALETRISVKRGLKPIRRYKASDCALRVNDFDSWGLNRQINFTKRLVEIMTAHPRHELPMVFAWGISLAEIYEVEPDATRRYSTNRAYQFCAQRCFEEIAHIMHEYYSDEKITFIHDDGEKYSYALAGFKDATDRKNAGMDQLITIAPMAWASVNTQNRPYMIT